MRIHRKLPRGCSRGCPSHRHRDGVPTCHAFLCPSVTLAGVLEKGGIWGAGRKERNARFNVPLTHTVKGDDNTHLHHTHYISLSFIVYTLYTPHAHIRVLLVFVTRNTRASTLATYAYTRESIRVFTTKHFFSLPRALARDKQNRGEKLLTRYLGCDLDATLFNVR